MGGVVLYELIVERLADSSIPESWSLGGKVPSPPARVAQCTPEAAVGAGRLDNWAASCACGHNVGALAAGIVASERLVALGAAPPSAIVEL